MRIAIGCDHGAFALKNKVIEHLEKQGHEVRDFGTYSTESCDYPDFAAAAARAVASGECQRGIVLCTTGIGVSITANKIDGIRCALLSDPWSAKMTRLHNDTNMRVRELWAKIWRWRSWTSGSARNSPGKSAISAGSIRLWRWKSKVLRIRQQKEEANTLPLFCRYPP